MVRSRECGRCLFELADTRLEPKLHRLADPDIKQIGARELVKQAPSVRLSNGECSRDRRCIPPAVPMIDTQHEDLKGFD